MGASRIGIGMNGTSIKCWDLEIGQAGLSSGTCNIDYYVRRSVEIAI